MFKDAAAGDLLPTPAAFPLPHKPSTPSAPSNTPQSITVSLRKKPWRFGAQHWRSHWGTSRCVMGIFIQHISIRQWSSVPQLLPCQTPHGKAGDSLSSWQTPASCWKEESSSRHLQPEYSCCSSFEGNLSLYCQHQFVHICRCNKFASDDFWEGKSIALKVCQ